MRENKLDLTYTNLLKDILENGSRKSDRTGTGTLSVFGRQIRHNMKDGFPLLTTKEVSFKTMVTELIWFLRGDTNIRYLVQNNCNIWNGDAYKNYINNSDDDVKLSLKEFVEKIKTDFEFAQKWGELGPIYGSQWRHWEGFEALGNIGTNKFYDQIEASIDMLKTNPDSRRNIVNAWNVGELGEMVLPPCHYGYQLYTRELTYKERYDIWIGNNYETGVEYNPNESNPIDFENDYYRPTPEREVSLMWNQRSVDTFLGLPFNISSYGTLLELYARECNMVAGELIGNLGDVHLYLNHIEQAKLQISRVGESRNLPILGDIPNSIQLHNVLKDEFNKDAFSIIDYDPLPKISAKLSN